MKAWAAQDAANKVATPCDECGPMPENYEWTWTLPSDGPVIICRTHGALAPAWTYEDERVCIGV